MSNVPKEYRDDTGGIRAEANQDGFNNIVYSTQNIMAKLEKGNFTEEDIDLYIAHVESNADEFGLYKPKNSHDNITYKILGSKTLGLHYERNMSLYQACKSVSFRPWDCIIYMFCLGGPIIRNLSRFFLWIPALQMIQAVNKAEKIRPKMFGDGLDSLYRWWFFKKTKIEERQDGPILYVSWKDYKGRTRITRHMQNDGKHISLFRLKVLKKESLTLAICAKICHTIFIDKYGEEYAYEVMRRYFNDANHPNISEFKGIKNFLED